MSIETAEWVADAALFAVAIGFFGYGMGCRHAAKLFRRALLDLAKSQEQSR